MVHLRSLLVTALLALMACGDGGEALRNVLDWRRVAATADNDELRIAESGAGSWEAVRGAFTIASGMADDPELTCSYATPGAKGGKPSPRAHDVVYFFHTPEPGQRDILDNPLCQRLVREAGMTVFGLAFVHSPYSAFLDPKQHQHSYAFAQSGSFSAIVTAWATLRQRLAITTSAFFVFGYSAGGTAAQRFAEEYPALCEGVVTANGHTFVQKRLASCPFLIIHTYGDAGLPQGDGLAALYRAHGNAVTRLCLSPNWGLLAKGDTFAYHALNQAATPLALRYLEGLADLRRASADGAAPAPGSWPYVMAAENPLLVASPHGRDWMAPFKSAGLTPAPLPSARFYREVLCLPPPSKLMEIAKVGTTLLARPAGGDAGRGVIAIWQAQHGGDAYQPNAVEIVQDLDQDLQYAAEHRFLAYTVVEPIALPKALPAILAEGGRGAAPAIAVILFAPRPDDVAKAIALPGLRRLVITLQDNDDLAPYLPILQRCRAAGTNVRALVSCTNPLGYQALIAPVDPALRDQCFASFASSAVGEDGSLHQRQLAAAVAFIEDGTEKAR